MKYSPRIHRLASLMAAGAVVFTGLSAPAHAGPGDPPPPPIQAPLTLIVAKVSQAAQSATVDLATLGGSERPNTPPNCTGMAL